MNEAAFTQAQAAAQPRSRLDQLEAYLLEDPNNTALLTDAFEAALQAGQWNRAEFHLRHGQALQSDRLAWALREGDYWLAQQRYDQAEEVLQRLQSSSSQPVGFAEVLLHNLAYVSFRRGNDAECIARLAPHMEAAVTLREVDTSQPLAVRALQQLWLRALHRNSELTRAFEWAGKAERDHQADAQTLGVASLAALDLGEMTAAQRWSSAALAQAQASDRPMEALVTQASLALAARDGPAAIRLSDAALSINPGDGRAWSARAYADLLNNDLPAANDHFARALAAMPEHIGTWHGQGWTQLLSRQLDAAQISFETALARDRNFAESHGSLAVVLAMKKQTTAAHEHIERAMRLDRDNFSGRYAQAILNGEVQDAASIQRLARRLMGKRAAPLGGKMADALPAGDGEPHEETRRS